MWRSFFLAVGIMMVIVGAECLIIESATLYAAAETSAADFIDPDGNPGKTTKVVSPSEWMPWTLLSCGAIVILYAFTLPKRWAHG